MPYTEGDGSLYDVLGLPPEWANEVYTEQYGFEDKGQVDGYGYSVNTATGSNSSIAAGIQWLRDLSVQDKEGYNSLVYSLYAAGYLSAADTRYGSFTSGVAEAFANAAHDTYVINQSQSGGSTTTLFNHLDDLAAGYEESGTGPSGSSSNATEPVRVDQWTDRDTLTANLRAAAQNALGRSLTDDETAAFVSAFHGQEQTWNDEQWAAQNGTGTSITDRPSASATAQDYVGNQFEQEKAGQDLGSYMGVLRNLMGLGTGGVGSAAG